MDKLNWTKVNHESGSVDYLTPLPEAVDVGEFKPATQVLRWYNRQERSWVTSFADEDGHQVGSSDYDGTKEASDASVELLFERAAELVARRAEAVARVAEDKVARPAQYVEPVAPKSKDAGTFKRGKNAGTAKCVACGKRRQLANMEADGTVCSQCYHEAGIENAHADGYHADEPATDCRECFPATVAEEPAPTPGTRQCVGLPKYGVAPHAAPAETFGKNAGTKDGVSRTCKACNTAWKGLKAAASA